MKCVVESSTVTGIISRTVPGTVSYIKTKYIYIIIYIRVFFVVSCDVQYV